MGISLRGSRRWKGNPPISLGATARMERFPEPISLRAMATASRGKSFPLTAVAGDVHADLTFSIHESGAWLVIGTLHDTGGVTGENWDLDLELVGVSGYGVSYEGSIGTAESTDLARNGSDPVIRDHFDEITEMRATLHASEQVGNIISTIITTLAAVFAAIFFSTGPPKKPRPCPDQMPYDEFQKCVEFVPVGSSDGGGSGTVSDGSADPGEG